MEISSSLVKELRARTGVGIMDCKKALVEAAGDVEAAVELMRKSGLTKASKKADRATIQGAVDVFISEQSAALLEVNCETDFVAKSNEFLKFVNGLGSVALSNAFEDVTSFHGLHYEADSKKSVEDMRLELVSKIGENIVIKRVEKKYVASGNLIGSYVHENQGLKKIAVLVELSGTTETQLARDIAMHISWSQPTYLTMDSVPQSLIDKEREVQKERALQRNIDSKNIDKVIDDDIDKVIDDGVKKYFQDLVLLEQPFVKDQSIRIGAMLKRSQASIESYMRYAVGETK